MFFWIRITTLTTMCFKQMLSILQPSRWAVWIILYKLYKSQLYRQFVKDNRSFGFFRVLLNKYFCFDKKKKQAYDASSADTVIFVANYLFRSFFSFRRKYTHVRKTVRVHGQALGTQFDQNHGRGQCPGNGAAVEPRRRLRCTQAAAGCHGKQRRIHGGGSRGQITTLYQPPSAVAGQAYD